MVRNRFVFFVLSASLATAGTLGAQVCPEEPTSLRHYNPAGQQSACPCFVVGEEFGAVFTAPPEHYPIEILKIRVGWGAVFGNPPSTLENALKIYPAGLPNPGAPQFTLPGPVLTAGAINEFDIEFVPGNKVIASGPFSATLEIGVTNANMIFNASGLTVGPSCTSGVNLIRSQPGGIWQDGCSAGISGNWLFEVTYRIANCETLNRDVSSLSLSGGGAQIFTLAAGASEAGKIHWLVGSLSGTTPGIPVPGVGALPLNDDAYLQYTIANPNGPLYVNSLGNLDAFGNTFAALVVPPGVNEPALVGLEMNHAYITVSTPGVVDIISNAQPLLLLN